MTDETVYQLTYWQRVLVLATVVLGSTIYTATVLISSALLPQMQGALSATQDEISWTMTFNIVATAVATPMTGWLAARFGRRATMVWCATGFSVATLFCGFATSLESLVFWRVVQGAAGAPLVPLGQAILLDAFPQRQHGFITAIYGMANMIGPALGPTLGGRVSEEFGWRWGFWMVLPVAVLTAIGFRFALPPDPDSRPISLDWLGFISLSIAIAGAQLVFSRGQRLDWFESNEVIVVTFLACVSLYMFVVHSLTAERPFIRLRLLADRNYALGLAMVTLFGMLNFAPIVLMPPLLQQQAGFPDSEIGAFVGWRGIGAALGFFLAMLLQRLDPRITMLLGASMQAIAGFWMLTYDLNVSTYELGLNSCLQGMSVGLSWVPMTVITFYTLPAEHRAEAMAMFHLLRNVGSSLFISVAVSEIVRATGANYARMVETVSSYNRLWDLPWVSGAWSIDTVQGAARFAREINRQATMIGYSNAFVLYTVVACAILPLCLLARMKPARAVARQD
ncbi:MAG: DHA2 family efflux MFS transporter permease subunit [Hyphomicrobiaceae bacterium]